MDNRPYRYDRFGERIYCRFCKSRKLKDNHHPQECKSCYSCGVWGHHTNFCLYQKDCKPFKVMTRKPTKINEEIKSAYRYPQIDNIHLLRPNEAVSLDIECVAGFGKQLPGWIIIYRYDIHSKVGDKIIFSTKIHQRKQDIYKYFTKYSGLTGLDLGEGTMNLVKVQSIIRPVLKDRLVVGIGLKEDLQHLGLEEISGKRNIFEFKDIFKDENGQAIGLKSLAYAFLGKKIQQFDPKFDPNRGHSPVVDAMMTMKIYRAYEKLGKSTLSPLRYDEFSRTKSYQWAKDIVDMAKECGAIKDRSKNNDVRGKELAHDDSDKIYIT